MFDCMYDESVLTLLLCIQKWVSADGEERKSDSKVNLSLPSLICSRVCAHSLESARCLSRDRALSLVVLSCCACPCTGHYTSPHTHARDIISQVNWTLVKATVSNLSHI